MINTKYLLVILILSSTIFAQQSNIGYEWKLKPGMLEWKELTTHKQMLEVLQIPKESLKNMTTVELVYTCLNYPLFPDIWAYNSLQKGMEYVISDFNGLQEILKREDSGATLFTIYKKMDPNNYNKVWSDLEKGYYTAEFSKIEILMAQEQILNNLSEVERNELIKEALIKYSVKQKHNIYDISMLEPIAFLIGRILLKNYPDEISTYSMQKLDLQFFLQHGSMTQKITINDLVRFAQQIINS